MTSRTPCSPRSRELAAAPWLACLMAALAAALACGPKLPGATTGDDDPSSGSVPSTSESPDTTAAPTSAGTLDPPSPTTSGTGELTGGSTTGAVDPGTSTGVDGSGFIVAMDGGGCEGGNAARLKWCDPWTQDCPDDQKCVAASGGCASPEWEITKCVDVPAAPGQPGDPCAVEGFLHSGVDSCAKGSFCWFVDVDTLQGTCVPQCAGSPEAPVCPQGSACMPLEPSEMALCVPSCDPLASACPEGQQCISSGPNFVCAPGGDDLPAFSACSKLDSCAEGLGCVDAAGVPACAGLPDCCAPLCDLDAPACPDALACTPWDGDAPANVGVCLGAP